MMTDTEIESVFVCADPDKPSTMRCQICYVGFSGERTMQRAVKHIMNSHKQKLEEYERMQQQ